MLKTYANCWEGTKAGIQQFFLTILLIAGLTQIASATCTINGGTIGNAQTGCVSFNPAAITNVTSVSSPYGGPFEYVWLVTTDINAVNGNNTNWTVIANSNSATYDPGTITQTTWYRRCARRAFSYCPNFDGESNWVKMTVNAAPNATITANSTITQGQSKTLTATGGGTYAWSNGATSASITVSPATTTTYTVTVTGSNGCTAVKSTTVTVTPATGTLTYNCTADITVTAASGATTAVVTYANQTATSTCPVGTVSVTRTAGLASGSAFPVGTTQVCHRATDGCGNVKDCCFNVIVNPGTPAINCNGIGIVGGNGAITVNGVTGAPVISIQVFDGNWNTVYNQFFTNSPGSVSIPNLAGGNYYAKVQFLTATWTEICKKEQTVTVTGSGGGCSNVTNGGTIGGSQTICPGATPTMLTSVSAPSGGSGNLEYLWLSSTSGCPTNINQAIAGATGATYTPGVLSQTTYFVRCSRRAGCTEWTAGESNCVTVTVSSTGCNPTADCSGINFTASNGAITVGNLSNTGGITIIQAYDANWNQVFNQYYTTTPASVAIPNLAAGNYWIKAQYLTSAWIEICKKEQSITVTVTGGGCSNVTSGGTIGGSQTVCPGATPAMLTSVTAPSGGSGNIEYMWLSSTTACPTNVNQAIAGATGATYTPGALSQTTYFVRCSRRAGCTDWTTGESNCVTVTVSSTGCNPTADCSNISFTPASNTITVGNLSNAGGITIIQAYDANWNQVFNQYYTSTPSSVVIPNLVGGNYWVKAQYLTSAWAEICKKEQIVTIQGTTPTPSLRISDITVNENAGTASLQICASVASASPITVTYTTQPNTAIAGNDYITKTATATIPAGQTCVTVTFDIVDDNVLESTEVFHVYLSNASGATIGDLEGLVTILDNDNAPQFDCTTASIVVSGSQLVVSNLANAPIIIVQAADPSWNQIFNQWYTTNPGTVNIPTTVGGTYYVKVQYLTSAWSEICKKEVYLTVVGTPTGVLTFPQPANITVTAPQGATSMVVNYPTPTASSTCTVGSVNVTRISGPASGSSFPVGTTQVCYRATDGCGNSIDRCFNVVVNAPAAPVCNITRAVTNNVERGSGCTSTGVNYGMWFNVAYPATTSRYYTFSNATFTENADGTASLTAVATNTQNSNIRFNVSANFCGRTYAAPVGSPKAPCYSYNSNGWYYYTTMCGTLTGTNGAAGTVIQLTRRGEAFQVGTGANLNENVFGASGWFNTFVTSGSVAGLTEGDFNFNLSGTPTAPSCGTGTANCTTVPCYTAPSFETCTSNGCTSFKGKINSAIVGNSMSYSEARDNCNQMANSSATLTIPAGSVVKKAYLNWSGTGSLDNSVSLNGQSVFASSTKTDHEPSWGLDFFMATADVTSLIQQGGSYTVSNLTWNSSGNYCQSNAAYGAWSLTVVYENPSLPVSVITYCDDTFDFSFPAGTYTSTVNNCFSSTCATNNSGTLSIVAYEGDNYKTEDFIVNGVVQSGTNNFRGQTAPNLDIFTVSVPGAATSSLTTGVRSWLQNTVWGSAIEGLFIGVKVWRYTSCNQSIVAKEESVILSAERSGKSVNLRWLSNTGTDNATYIVERSQDGTNYTAITSGDGFSTDAIAYYNEVDAQPAKADNYYRVRMILNDGSEHVSNEQRVFMPEVGSFGMYPNPANERVTLDASDFAGQNVQVQLFNQLGKLVKNVEVDATSGIIELDLTDMNSGFYGVSIESNGVKRSSKLLVTKQ